MSGYIPSLSTIVKGGFASAVGVSSVGIGLLYYGQNYLIYPSAFPPGSRTEVPIPTGYGLPYEDLKLETSDNVNIRVYLLVQRKHLLHAAPVSVSAETKHDSDDDEISDTEFASTRPTIMMFHGNGGNMGHRIPLAKVFYLHMRCNVMLLSYRGYGMSEGSPSEKGFQLDAQAALDYILSHDYLSKTPVILYGQSIGGALAIDLTSRNPHTIRALILENTFLSLPKLIPNAFPFLSPVTFLCHQKWDSVSKLPLIPGATPILMLSGSRDEVVPPEHMRELERLLRTTPDGKRRPGRFIEFANGTHNNTCVQPEYWRNVSEFVADV